MSDDRQDESRGVPRLIANYTIGQSHDGQPVRCALDMTEIREQVEQRTGGWPRRVGGALFVDDTDHGIGWLTKPHELFGWLQSAVGRILWQGGIGFVRQTELFSEVQRTAKPYRSVEVLPHEPMLDDHYYTCGPVQAGNGDTLRFLVERFAPETDIDRDLLLAAFVTPGWGGPPGARPAFVVTSDFGRGVGKTTVAKMIAHLWGGLFDINAHEDASQIKTRLLTGEALPKRVALIDNVKSYGFSWADLEAFVTASEISGKRNYVGEATRPNTLTWFVTLNGASLSKDMAQRSVIIKVKRPSRTGTWEEDTIAFINANRDKIIADCIGVLRSDPFPLATFTRWGTWEKDILQRLSDPSEAQKVILERQQIADVENEGVSILEDGIEKWLSELHYEPDDEQVFIPSKLFTELHNQTLNERLSTTMVSRKTKQLIDEGTLQRLRVNTCNAYGRGFVWIGKHADVDRPIRLDITKRIAMRDA